MIASLFGMTDHATDYKPTSMVTAMFEDYIHYSVWLFLFVGYMAAGLVFFYLLGKVKKIAEKKAITYAFEALYALGLFVVLRFAMAGECLISITVIILACISGVPSIC